MHYLSKALLSFMILLGLTGMITPKAQSQDYDEIYLKYDSEKIDNTAVYRPLPIFNSSFVFPSKDHQKIKEILTKHQIKVSKFNKDSCTLIGSELYQELYNLNPEEYLMNDVKQNALSLVTQAFNLIIQLKTMYNKIPVTQISDECLDATRKAFLALRSFGDYVGHVSKLNIPSKKGSELPAGTLYNPTLTLEERHLKSGDIIVSRGNAYSSATISRITDVVTQFSHLAIVYIDPQTLEKSVIEAHIEQGTIVTTWKKYIEDGKIRALVLRQENEALAHESAKAIRDHVLGYQKKHNNENIPYDFGMNLTDPSEFFCSEVVQYAYKLGSKKLNAKNKDKDKDEFKVPQFLSKSTKNNIIKQALGISDVKAFFSPIDVEVDTRFNIVAEFKNYALMNQAWEKDAVLTFLFENWNEKNITLNPTLESEALTTVAKSLRNTKLGEKYLKEKVPKNGPYKGVLMMTILNIFMSKKIDEWVENVNKTRILQGLPVMNYSQTLEHLNSNNDEFIDEFSRYLKFND
jgi:hypothetical protein